ncbi:MAG: Gfo/Idh/MocA family oxidoreductase [Chitinophagaceae bacterium]|nr:MAG: Gfo/Idh/MocA family oxidoreductase [Chitinophagaceae bacterium]
MRIITTAPVYRLFLLPVLCFNLVAGLAQQKPLRIGIAGLTHSHVHWIFNSARSGSIEIVGIAEADTALAGRFIRQYHYPAEKIFPDLVTMLDATKPEAVAAFNSIAGHLGVAQTCAPRKIHVMVEKPLAVSLADAKKMQALANTHKIHLLTNYETTWYPTVHETRRLLADSLAGTVRKMVIHDGHQGPAEIGVNKEFLDWLTDPVQNGAGALMDFGCYGADMATWIMNGKRPSAVTAVTQQIKPHKYPKVDDEATIILEYPGAQVIIQASWNWTFSRKDLELYGTKGIVTAVNKNTMRTRFAENKPDSVYSLPDRKAPMDDPFSFFQAVVRGTIAVPDNDLSSLPVNMVVMEILDAAKRSAAAHKTITLP